MSKLAFLFPGQGSQAVGMGSPLVDNYPQTQALFDQARDILGWDLLQVCKEGPEERLKQTDVAQPALYVTGYAAAQILISMGLQPDAVAGHSIGEYAALATAGVFSFETGLKWVKERARLMRDAGQANPGSMAAILGMTGEQVQALCQEASAKGVCAAVNFNSPEQTVIAGEVPALEEAGRIAPARGAKRVIPLNVSGAFHSPLMRNAAQEMIKVLNQPFQKPSIPVAMNADGALHSVPAEISQVLGRQLDSPVQWVKSIEALKQAGCTIFVECGSGRVLTGLLRRIDRQLVAYSTDTAEAIKEAGVATTTRKG